MALLFKTMLWLLLPSLWTIVNDKGNTTIQLSVLAIAGSTLVKHKFVCNFMLVADGMW